MLKHIENHWDGSHCMIHDKSCNACHKTCWAMESFPWSCQEHGKAATSHGLWKGFHCFSAPWKVCSGFDWWDPHVITSRFHVMTDRIKSQHSLKRLRSITTWGGKFYHGKPQMKRLGVDTWILFPIPVDYFLSLGVCICLRTQESITFLLSVLTEETFPNSDRSNWNLAQGMKLEFCLINIKFDRKTSTQSLVIWMHSHSRKMFYNMLYNTLVVRSFR